MEDDVQREREAGGLHPRGDLELVRERRVPGDAIGAPRVGALDAELHVLDAGAAEGLEAIAGEGDAARDEVGVEAGRARAGDELLEIAARERLAAGEVHLHHAERGGLGEDAAPVVGGELSDAAASSTGLEQ